MISSAAGAALTPSNSHSDRRAVMARNIVVYTNGAYWPAGPGESMVRPVDPVAVGGGPPAGAVV